jgi:hypothetical protein
VCLAKSTALQLSSISVPRKVYRSAALKHQGASQSPKLQSAAQCARKVESLQPWSTRVPRKGHQLCSSEAQCASQILNKALEPRSTVCSQGLNLKLYSIAMKHSVPRKVRSMILKASRIERSACSNEWLKNSSLHIVKQVIQFLGSLFLIFLTEDRHKRDGLRWVGVQTYGQSRNQRE